MTEPTRRVTRRIQLIDGLRGLSILLMVAYHWGFDMVSYGYFPSRVLYNPLLNFLEPLFAGLFIFLSGISCRFSRSNVKRGVQMLLFALLLSLVTYLLEVFGGMGEVTIRFGILHFMGSAALLFGLLSRFLDKIPYRLQPLLYGGLFIAAYVFFPRVTAVPGLFMFGMMSPGFSSADYFPLLPWIFLYLLGAWFGTLVVSRRLPDWFYDSRFPFFSAAGRYTLPIYLLHQPVLIGLILLIRLIFPG